MFVIVVTNAEEGAVVVYGPYLSAALAQEVADEFPPQPGHRVQVREIEDL